VPKNGVQKSGGPTQSPGPLGPACIDAQLESAAHAIAHSVSRNHGEYERFIFMTLNSLARWARGNGIANAAGSKRMDFARLAGHEGGASLREREAVASGGRSSTLLSMMRI
jgi:hypothetical protein